MIKITSYSRLPNRISEDLNAYEVLFISELVNLSEINKSLTFQVTNIHLSKRCRCSIDTVKRIKKKFKEQGVYECTSKQDSNKNEATIYTLNPAKMNEILGEEAYTVQGEEKQEVPQRPADQARSHKNLVIKKRNNILD